MSRDEATGQTSAQRVKQTFERQADATLVLRLKNGETIETTKEHPFYVESQGFTAAGEMGIGTSIVTRAGPSAILASWHVRDQKATVYNFEVENTHTYFVGHSELWVHNVCKIFASKRFWNHFLYGEGIHKRLLKGAHRLDAFENQIEAGLVRQMPNTTRTKIAEGIYEIRYQVAKLDGKTGAPVGWKAEADFPKTVFDPQIIPEWQFKKYMLDAAEQGLAAGTYTPNGTLLNGVTKNGLKMEFRTTSPITSTSTKIELDSAYFVR